MKMALKRMSVKNYFLICLCLVVVGALAACSTLSAGRKYTLVKMDRKAGLVEARSILDPDVGDDLDKRIGGPATTPSDLASTTNNLLRITLNGGYIRYLQSFNRPEVVIFARTRVQNPVDPFDSFV